MTLQRYAATVVASHYSNIHVSIPPDPDFGTSQSAMMVAVEVDEMSPLSSQLFKDLILGPYSIRKLSRLEVNYFG